MQLLRLERVDVRSSNEQPSVCTASKNEQIDVLRSLLDRSSDVDERDSLRKTALALALRNGVINVTVAKLLIERGTDVN